MKTISFVIPITWLSMMEHGCGNGYVAIPAEHPLFGKDYDDINEKVSVHSGLTYSDKTLKGQPKETEGMWIVGFDTCHGGDTLRKWPKEAVERETERLKKQIDEMA